MPLAEDQWSLRGLVLGPGTIYRLMDDSNPFVRTVRPAQTAPRAWGRGSWSGAEWANEAVIPLRILIDTPEADKAAYLAAHQQLAAAFAAVEDDPAVVELRYEFGGAEYVLFGRPRMVEPDLSLAAYGRGFTRCAFVALDPLHYSGAENSIALGLPSTSGGLTVPLQVPFTIPATVTAGRATIANAGRATVGLVLRIDGPVQEPRVSVLTPAGPAVIRLFLTLTSGQWLDIDTAARTVYLNGTASRRGNAAAQGLGWPTLPPGDSEIAFDASAFDAAAELTVTWRDAWH